MRIAIMGYSGGGKTYLANVLSSKYEIPVLHLDEVKYDKEWKPIDDEVVMPLVSSFMEKQNWIIEGNYNTLLQEERLDKADEIVFILLPRLSCLYRSIKRTKKRKMEGYKNDINSWFLFFVLFGCRNRERKAQYSEIIKKHKEKTIILKTQRQIDRYINSL